MKANPSSGNERREFLVRLAWLSGAALSPSLVRAVTAGAAGEALLPGKAGRALSAVQVAFVDRVSELIIPRTETPGASDAGVVGFIDRLLAEYEDEPGRKAFLGGLEAFRRKADEALTPSFMSAPESRQFAFLEAEDAAASKSEQPTFFADLKQKVVTGYYTSEPGATQELLYLPVPGPFQPDIPVTAETRNYAQ